MEATSCHLAVLQGLWDVAHGRTTPLEEAIEALRRARDMDYPRMRIAAAALCDLNSIVEGRAALSEQRNALLGRIGRALKAKLINSTRPSKPNFAEDYPDLRLCRIPVGKYQVTYTIDDPRAISALTILHVRRPPPKLPGYTSVQNLLVRMEGPRLRLV